MRFIDLRFIDSAGVGALLSVRERTRSLEIGMRLTNVPDAVQRMLELGGVDVREQKGAPPPSVGSAPALSRS